MIYRGLMVAVCLLAGVTSVRAQGDLDAERSSLGGLSSFAVRVTVEGPRHLAESDVVGASALGERATARLHNAGLPVTTRSGTAPHLQIHVNMMSIETGLIPFSIELGFYQEVSLKRNGFDMSAETWNESVVGLVSHDLVPTIAESVDQLVDQFAADFKAAD